MFQLVSIDKCDLRSPVFHDVVPTQGKKQVHGYTNCISSMVAKELFFF